MGDKRSPIQYREPPMQDPVNPVRCAQIRLVANSGKAFDSMAVSVSVPRTDDEEFDKKCLRELLALGIAKSIATDDWT